MIGVGYYYLLFLLFVALPVAAIGAYTIGISPMADPTKSRQCCVVLFAVSLVATCSAVIFPPQQGEDGDSDNYKLYISAPKLLSSLVAGLLATAILKLFPPPSHSFPVAMIVSMGPFYLFPQQVSQVLSVMDLAKSKDASQSEEESDFKYYFSVLGHFMPSVEYVITLWVVSIVCGTLLAFKAVRRNHVFFIACVVCWGASALGSGLTVLGFIVMTLNARTESELSGGLIWMAAVAAAVLLVVPVAIFAHFQGESGPERFYDDNNSRSKEEERAIEEGGAALGTPSADFKGERGERYGDEQQTPGVPIQQQPLQQPNVFLHHHQQRGVTA